MRVLVTGASGFVGENLCHMLASMNISVTAVSRSQINHSENIVPAKKIITENTDWNDVLKEIDVIIHLANRAHVMKESEINPYAAYKAINVDGTLNLAKQASNHGVKRFIYMSSIKVNGESSDNQSYSEMSATQPEDDYGKSKYEAEEALKSLCDNSTMELVIIRPPLIYGPKVKANFLNLINLCKLSLPLPFGAINNKRSLIYIENLVAFITICLTHPKAANQTFLISDDDDQSTTHIIQIIKQALGKKPLLIPICAELLSLLLGFIGRKSVADRLLGNLQVDSSKAKNLLGWRPPYTFEEGIARTVAYYNKTK